MSDYLVEQYQRLQSRRRFLNGAGVGLGAAVLGSLVAKPANAAMTELPHFRPRANRVPSEWRACTNRDIRRSVPGKRGRHLGR